MDQPRGASVGNPAAPSPFAGDGVAIADSTMLLDSDFRTDGDDLVIAAADGEQVRVSGYFAAAQPADLVAADGVRLAGWLVAEVAQAGQPDTAAAVAQVAQAGAARIGVARVVSGDVMVTHVDGVREPLRAGDPVYAGDDLATGADGAVGIVFLDDTTFSLAENGRMVLDEMIYDPGAQEGSAVLSVVKGAFTFVSGQIAKFDADGMVLKTPTTSIGIRGTAAAGDVDDAGATRATLIEEQGQALGELVFNPESLNPVVLNVLNTLVTVASLGAVPTFSPITLQTVGQQFGRAILTLPNAEQHLPDTFRSTVRQIQQDRNDDAGDPEQPGQDAGGQDGDNDDNAGDDDDADADTQASDQDIDSLINVTELDVEEEILEEILDLAVETDKDEILARENPLDEAFENEIDETIDEIEEVIEEATGGDDDEEDDDDEDEPDFVESPEEEENDEEVVEETPASNTITGTAGNDVINGTAGADDIDALAGNDTISAKGGNDTVDGGAGNDVIDGGNGADILRGDAGADTFRINDPLHGADELVDFVSGTDVIELLKSAFSDPDLFLTDDYTAAGNPSIIVYDGTGLVNTPVVFYDQDGNNTTYASTKLAELPAGTTAALSDVSLI